MLATLYGLRSISSAFTSWMKMYKIGAISPLRVWHNLPVNLSGPHTFCFGRLLIIDLISLIDIHFVFCEFWQIMFFKELVHSI